MSMYPITVPLCLYQGRSMEVVQGIHEKVQLMALVTLLEGKPYGFNVNKLFLVLNKDHSMVVVPVVNDGEHIANSVVFRLTEEECAATLSPIRFSTEVGAC